ncbi:MAG: S9 family peptidase [Bdellovibrionaceae bacterium]|nr:S9 family peptidase [Pseudobdellovibrionaceae bacterium]NUM57501.1 S9 family peptidase [Pseudobdellovibrionaceae bacterium]
MTKNTKTLTPPKTFKEPVKLEKFGLTRTDNYFWLKNRENPKVLDYLKSENEYTEKVLSPSSSLKEQLFNEMKLRVIEDESSAPITRGNFEYSARFIPGHQYPIFERKDLRTQSKEILLDGNKEASDSDYFETTGPLMSHDQQLMAYANDKKGRRFYDLHIKNVITGKQLPIKVENITNNFVWSKNNNYLFYCKQHPETLRSYQVYRLDIRKNKSELIYEEKDETFIVNVYDSLAKEFIFILSSSTLSTEVRFQKSSEPLTPFVVFTPREANHEYEVIDGGDRFYIRSNYQAKNFRLFESSLSQWKPSQWKEIIPNRDDTLFENVIAFKDFLVVSEKKNSQDIIRYINRKNIAETQEIKFKDSTYTAELGTQAEFTSPYFRYIFESMRQPDQTFEFDFKSKKSTLVKERKVPNFDPEKYSSERLWITARDGQKIPVSVLKLKKDSLKSPLLLYAYGSYGASMPPWFSQSVFSLVDRGFTYAIAHIRGGSELGRFWYDEGRKEKKWNTFNDFIDVTTYFYEQPTIDNKNIFAMGGSAGGLLMGVINNTKPELYNGIVAQVPFVDVLTTMLDDSIPLTTGEYDEWGNPNDKKYFDYIYSYSPYDNVFPKKYPNLLITTGWHDSQVQYWEPAKWTAKLRDNNLSNSIILLKTELEAGHGGASGRYEQLKEKALEFSFILSTVK